MDLRSRLNTLFRGFAARFRPENPVRRWAATLWNRYLTDAGGFVSMPIHGESVRLSVAMRSFPVDYEQAALNAFLGLIAPGDIIWDIGANIGLYTILAARRVGSAGRVVSWEPGPATFRLLTDHVRANGLADRCELLQAAVHDGSTPEVSFWQDAADSVSSTNRMSSQATVGSGQTVRVEAANLDSWCDRLGRTPKVIKVDVEGAEVLVLRGAPRLMAGDFGPPPSFVVAVHPHMMPELGCRVEELVEVMKASRYGALDLDGRPAEPTQYAEYLLVPPAL